MVETSSGINLWAEWARLESAMARGEAYQTPEPRYDHAGILVSLSRYEHPDQTRFDDEEIVWKINKPFHVGLIVRSADRSRVLALLDAYAEEVKRDFHASAPPKDKPTH
jgi:hypothetical protein